MTFEVLKSESGQFTWRLRRSNGQVVKIEPGTVKLPPASAAKRRRIKAATQRALESMAGEASAQV